MPVAQRYTWVGSVAVVLLLAALWCAARPFLGIAEDAELYTIQALNGLMPGRFATDLWFQYGSQDQFTLFSVIYKPFLRLFGLAWGNFILSVIGYACWVAGLSRLAGGLFRDGRLTVIAMAGAIAIEPGRFELARSGDAPLTPRLFAEALTMWALGSMLRGYPLRALVLLGFSLFIHPLATLGGIAVLFFYQATRRPALWGLAAIAVPVILMLAYGGIQPFPRVLARFDAEWLRIVWVRDSNCFLTEWGITRWLPAADNFVLAAIVMIFADAWERRFVAVVLVVSAGGFLASLIGGDWLHNELIVDLQSWRAIWLLDLVVHLFAGASLLRVRARSDFSAGSAASVLAVTWGLLFLATFLPAVNVAAAAMALVTLGVCAWEHKYRQPLPFRGRFLVQLCTGAALGLTLVILYSALVTPPFVWWSIYGAAVAAVTLVVLWRVSRGSAGGGWTPRPLSALVVPAVLLALAGLGWDHRAPWRIFVDTADRPPAALAALLPGNGPIYWEGDVTVPWFVLKRPSYFSCDQGAGVLFSRGTAINFQRRSDVFRSLRTFDFDGHFCPAIDDQQKIFTRGDLSSVCAASPGLEALVLARQAADDPGAVWVAPAEQVNEVRRGGVLKRYATNTFFIYSCAALR